MNDPWTEIRELFPTFEGQSETGSEIRRLLADADALLAAAREYHEMIRLEWVKAGEEGRTELTLDEWIAYWYPKLAALPEHLR